MESQYIDLTKYRGNNSTLFTGRPQGEDARTELNLDKFDNKDVSINFFIPSGTSSFNPSFFLGLLYDSIKKLGIEKYHHKYMFTFGDLNEETHSVLKKNLEDGERNALNTINSKTGFNRFFKK